MITVGDCNKFKPFKSRMVTKQQLVEVFEAYRCEGVTVKDLSNRHGVSESVLNFYISKLLFYTKAEETKTILLQSKV